MLKNTLEYLYSLRNQGSGYGIERMERLLSKMDSSIFSFSVVHVAGTNGKGSTCAMLDSIYRENGYKVGMFSSPHLVELGERIRVNGRILDEKDLNLHVERLKPLAEQVENENAGMHPTFFEFMTAIAFSVFHEQNIDLAVIETGLGGRLDSTNVVNPEISVITTIAFDHCHLLGHTIEEIAREKAGIIKPGRPVLTGWLSTEANELIKKIADQKGANFHTLANHSLKQSLPETNLHGSYQKKNAALALKASEIITAKVPTLRKLSKRALMKVQLEGRWQILGQHPTVIMDACHNEEGAKALIENIESLPKDKDLVLWFGSLGKDRAVEVLRKISRFAVQIKFFECQQPRSCSFEELVSFLPKDYKGSIDFGRVSEANKYLSSVDHDKIILITGSIYLLGEVLKVVKKVNNQNGFNLQDLI